MGTWAAGPFENDSAADFVAGIVDKLMEPVDAFLASPEIDETFDAAFAAVAMLNMVMKRTPTRPWDGVAQTTRAPGPIVEALLACFDEQIDALAPEAVFKAEQRTALLETCQTFTDLLAPA